LRFRAKSKNRKIWGGIDTLAEIFMEEGNPELLKLNKNSEKIERIL